MIEADMNIPKQQEQSRSRMFFDLVAKNPYWRAGAFGVPFCTIMGFVRGEPLFLLGFGFFLALLGTSSIDAWRKMRK